MDFSGKLVLITGGSSGIGLETARLLVTLGASVALFARRKEQLELASQVLEKSRTGDSQEIFLIPGDVSRFNETRQTISHFMAEKGVPDILINSAGIVYPGKFINLTFEQYQKMTETNYLGMVNMCKLVLPEMVKQKRGYVVNVASMAALIPLYGYTGYAGSKYAIRGFTDCLRQEMRLLGINMSIVYPPDTRTPQLENEIPNRPALTQALAETSSTIDPELVAKSIVRGIERKKYVIIPGAEAKLLAHTGYLLGNALHLVMDIMAGMSISKAKKKTRRV